MWIVVPEAHPWIVSRDLFAKANANAENHPIKPNRSFYGGTYLLTSLVRCADCSYNDQGFTHKKTGNRYYVDGGYINKGGSVCKWHSIRQDKLEPFVLGSIREIFLSAGFEKRIEESVHRVLRGQPTEYAAEMSIIESTLKETSAKIQGLLRFAETGIQLESVAERILELEGQQRSLKQKRATLGQSHPFIDHSVGEIRTAVVSFLKHLIKTSKKWHSLTKKQLFGE